MLDISKFSISSVTPWLLVHGIKIIGILIATYIVNIFASKVVEKIIRQAVVHGKFSSEHEEKQRENTLIRVITKTIEIFLWISVTLIILAEVSVNIAPLIAGAGIAGLAIGLGGKALIQDIIAGLFIIFENQYRVGDVVRLNDTAGEVEDITLRMSVLRDLDGIVHYIPNGTITKASNYSKDFARININVGVAYDTDIEEVKKIVNGIGADFAKDPKWAPHVKKAPHFLRVESLADSAIEIKVIGEVDPLSRWSATGEMKHRIKEAFEKASIEIPYPQQVVHNTEYKKK